MAVYTDVSDSALAAFVAGYDLGAVTAFKGIAEGVENTNFFLQTQSGSFILTLYEKRVAEGDLPFFMALLSHVAKEGLSCPRPVPDRAGALIGTLEGRKAALFTFLSGVSVRRPEAAHCAQVGDALAALHLATQNFPLARPNALSLGGWQALSKTISPRAGELNLALPELIRTALSGLETSWPQNLPRGVIHADLFPDNVLFFQGRLSGLIDFYFACNDFLAYDIAVALNAWCFEGDGSFNVTKARALVGGYQARRALSLAELAALPVLCRGAALRFLLTRAHDLLHHDPAALVRPKDPMEYAGKLRFFLQAPDTGALGL